MDILIPALAVLGCLATIALTVLAIRQRGALKTLAEDREHIVVEERRLFAFLHTLGETLRESNASTKAMHQTIVEGAAKVVEAEGGALYLRSGKNVLVPRFHSAHCPPLINLPERIVQRAKGDRSSLQSFLQLHSLEIDEAVLIGGCYADGEPLRLDDLRADRRFRTSPNPFQSHVAAMFAPLRYGEKSLGVLAVASSSRTFTDNDFEVFLSIAEQSALALGNAIIHEEANEKRRLERELRNASEIQRILLPSEAPDLADYRFASINIPAKVVSGDYFDYVKIDERRFGVVIGDVSGKGIPAALITAMARSVLRANAPSQPSPSHVLSAVNRLIFPDIREDMFITQTYVVLDRESDRINLARAGHCESLYFSASDDTITPVPGKGIAVGIDGGPVFDRVIEDVSITMATGDILVLFTDGVIEAIDRKGLEYGDERMRTTIVQSAGKGAEAVVNDLRNDLETFLDGAPAGDDITLIAIEKR